MPVDRGEIGAAKTEYLMRCLATMSAVQSIIETRFGIPDLESASDFVAKVMEDNGIDWAGRSNLTEFEVLKLFRAVASAIATECEEALNE